MRAVVVRRPRRLLVILSLAVSVILLVPAGANSLVNVQVPPIGMCLGGRFILGVRYVEPGRHGFSVTVTDPSGRQVWTRSGRATETYHLWRFVPGRTGTFKTVYRIPGPDRSFRTRVHGCGDGFVLIDDDYGTSILSMRGAKPGSTDVGCHLVTYAGDEAARVHLYGETAGTGLDRFLRLTVTRGRLSGSPTTCAGFRPDSTDYRGKGPGVIYRGTLRGFPDSYQESFMDAAWRFPEIWSNGESHAYRFEVRLKNRNRAQGLTASQRFIWSARPS
jgi:hypothetical protein